MIFNEIVILPWFKMNDETRYARSDVSLQKQGKSGKAIDRILLEDVDEERDKKDNIRMTARLGTESLLEEDMQSSRRDGIDSVLRPGKVINETIDTTTEDGEFRKLPKRT